MHDKWYKTKAKEMLIEFGKMKHIMSDWLNDTFNESPTIGGNINDRDKY